MREKDKQDSFSGERFSGTTEEIRAGASVRGPAPIYDDETLARRAGEIIARAVSAAGRIVRSGSKRKY
jgi:hypothetical protein